MERASLLMARYPFPWDLILPVGSSILRGERSLLEDCADVVRRIEPLPIVRGAAHIPMEGPVMIVANHYQRRGLWIGWTGAAITVAVGSRRSGTTPVHWLTTGGIQMLQGSRRGPEIPLARSLLRRVAAMYSLTALPLSGGTERAAAIRAWVRWLELGEVVGIFPEGLAGRSDHLRRPEPGFAALLDLVQRAGATIIPVGVHEAAGRLAVDFGPPASGGHEQVMSQIASLLPAPMRGPYPAATAPAPGTP